MRSLPLLALLVCPLAAQTYRATLTAVVMDLSRGVIASAKVSLHAATTGLDYGALTNAAGVYTLYCLPVGQYTA